MQNTKSQATSNATSLVSDWAIEWDGSKQEIEEALDDILSSRYFIKARRLNHLLRYLVDKRNCGNFRDLTEYAIGIEFFDRDPAVYSTGEDPIVRVQIGRLREKLKLYYASQGRDAALRILIPLGSYVPVVEDRGRSGSAQASSQSLVFVPLACLVHDEESRAFTQGLNEELGHQLFTIFGANVRTHAFHDDSARHRPNEDATAWNTQAQESGHWLEGGIRIEQDSLRACIRIIAAPAGCVVWSQRFERQGPLNMALQENLAVEIGRAVRTFLTAR